jgi:hypothetical protein
MKQVWRRSIRLVVSLALLAALWAAYVERQSLYDWWRLRGYTPPATISVLADRTTMNDGTRRLFYVYHPELDDAATFNAHCRENSEQTIVLGCYISLRGIYLFDVQDKRLDGVLEVTAAHETLHAAYDRLSASEKKRIDNLLNQAYVNINDERIRANVESYRQQGADVTNELHSILGTEVRNLPAELEQYYGRYFTDRAKIVSYSEQYEQAFIERRKQIEAYDVQLSALEQQIDANEQRLDSQEANLEEQRRQLDALLAARQYEQYNAAVPGFNAQVRAYNNLSAATQQLIDTYNATLTKYNAVVLEERGLYQAIDSRPTMLQTE